MSLCALLSQRHSSKILFGMPELWNGFNLAPSIASLPYLEFSKNIDSLDLKASLQSKCWAHFSVYSYMLIRDLGV